MAEFVQQSIEEMLPELEQMARVELFTENETRQILKKRKTFEYKLRRKTKQKQDYLQYIQYECHVLQLVKKRRQKTGYTFKKTEIDWAIAQRIHRLFRQVTLRFKEDVKVWLSHIQFSKSNNEATVVSKLFTALLQVHSKKPDLWLLAAKWEFEESRNPENARSMMQRGLRFNPSSKEMWLEYFRLELLYVEKMLKRREILLQAKIVESDETPDEVLKGKVAEIVYRQGMDAFPDNVQMVLSFLDISQKFDFAKALQEKILKDLQTDYTNHPLTWNALARRQLLSDEEDRIGKFHRVFEDAVKNLHNSEMWALYIKAYRDVLEENAGSLSGHENVDKLLELYEKCEREHCSTSELYCQWSDTLVKFEKIERAQEVLDKAVSEYPECLLLWKRRLQLMMEIRCEENQILKIFNKARKSLKDQESLPLWQLVLDYCITCKSQRLPELFEKGSLCCAEVSQYVKVIHLEWMFLRDGIAAARKLYTKLQIMKPLPLLLYTKCIQMESSLSKPDISRLRGIYEDAIRDYGNTESDLWIQYINLEQDHPKGQPENINQIYYRAKSTLVDHNNQDFIKKFSLLGSTDGIQSPMNIN